MEVIKASKTMAAIEAALSSDNCSKFRQNLKWLLPKMDDAYRGDETPFRRHLGASMIGRDCSRELQLKWKWVAAPSFPERVLRLFNRGHLEEARFLSMLMCVDGVELWYETEEGGQFKWDNFGGHYGSALDGIAVGVPDLEPGVPCYTEFKTSADAGFKKTQKNGCRAEHFEHFVQMQQCMYHYQLPFALYMVVNKNNDEIYAEIIPYDEDTALRYTNRAGEIIFTNEALPRISNLSTFWKCKFCDVKGVCHGRELPAINCRTCCHWSPTQDGGFTCARNNDEVHDKVKSMAGCNDHVYDPTLLPAYSFLGGNAEGNYTELQTRSGANFKQGPNHVTSEQLRSGLTPTDT